MNLSSSCPPVLDKKVRDMASNSSISVQILVTKIQICTNTQKLQRKTQKLTPFLICALGNFTAADKALRWEKIMASKSLTSFPGSSLRAHRKSTFTTSDLGEGSIRESGCFEIFVHPLAAIDLHYIQEPLPFFCNR